MADPTQPNEHAIAAFLEERFVPAEIAIDAPDEPAAGGRIALKLYAGPTHLPHVYHRCLTGQLDPDTAIKIGETLIEEGRRHKTGLLIARPGVPADL